MSSLSAPMVRPAVTARTPTSAPGSNGLISAHPPADEAGFSLVELLVVLLLIALVSGLAGLALRDGGQAALEREALRLSALLEAGRAEARASGVPVRFELTTPGSDPAFRFIGLPPESLPAGHWLNPELRARIEGASALRLGPEPLIGAQRILLTLGERELVLATDGLAPFSVQDPVPR